MTVAKQKAKKTPIPEKVLLSEYYANKHRAYNSMMDVFDERIENEGLTQEDLAVLLSINKGVVSRRLNGSANITLKTLSNMATALRCKLNVNFQPVERLTRANGYSLLEGVNSKFSIVETGARTQWSATGTDNYTPIIN